MPTDQLAAYTVDAVTHGRTLDYMRFLSCRTMATTPAAVADLFVQRWPSAMSRELVLLTKAAVSAGTTTDASWASPLVTPAALADGFLALVRSASLIGRIPGLRKVPFNVRTPVQTSGGTFYWVQENAPKPITKFGIAAGITLLPTKGEGMIVVSRELAQLTMPGTEPALRDALVNGLTSFTDHQFLDPAVAAVAGKNPGAITNGVAPITASGNVDTDVAAALAALFTARPNATGAVVLASPAVVSKLAGTGKNPDARVGGGTVQGVAIIATDAALTNIVAIDPAAVFVADAGVEVDVSDRADVQFDDAPVGTAAAVVTSLWQTNQVGFRVERFLNYQAVTGAVAYVANVT